LRGEAEETARIGGLAPGRGHRPGRLRDVDLGGRGKDETVSWPGGTVVGRLSRA